MPFNGSGVFQRVYNWVSDKNSAINITASRVDTEDTGFATGLSNCICRDGQSTITANLPMSGFAHTGVGNATLANQYGVVSQIQNSSYNWIASGGTSDAITATYSPAITTLVDGMELNFRATATSATTTPTFSPNGITAHTITKFGGSALVVGDIIANVEMILRYNLANTRWEWLNPTVFFISQLAGFRNKLINGDFRRWDYAITSALTTTATAYQAANRWFCGQPTAANGIFNQDTSITAGLGFKYNTKIGRTAASASTNAIYLGQALESSNSIPLAGKAITLSFYAKCGANWGSNALAAELLTGTGTDQAASVIFSGGWTGGATVINQVPALTTSWQRFQYTTTLASSVTQLAVLFQMTPAGTAGADDNFYITGIQIEPGTAATPFEDIGEGETALLCSRYAPIFGSVTGPIGTGAATSTSASGYFIPFQVPTRVAPTGLSVTTVGDFEIANFAGTDVAATTGFTFSKGGPNGAFITATVSGTPLTSGAAYLLYTKTALLGNLIFTGTEL